MKFIMVIALLTGCVTYDDHELRCEHQRLEDALHEVRWRVMSGLAKGDVEHLVGLRKKKTVSWPA